MTEFLFGYFSGIASAMVAGVIFMGIAGICRVDRQRAPGLTRHDEDQPDIYLTKINSTSVREYYHD